jgi:hypothetical protein
MLTPLLLISLLHAGSGPAVHPWDLPGIEPDEDAPQVFAPTARQQHGCARAGHLCFSPGGSATSEGVELRAGAAPVTVLARGAQVAAVGALHAAAADQPWQVEMVATFARRSAGPLVVAVMDDEDPEALANHLAVVVWDVDRISTRNLGLRFLLTPDQGFRPSHSYRVRILESKDKTEKLLAEGELHLE